jgi:lysophospholipid acyltransferase (LPLAT)-like uncharacterized protein
VPGLPESRVATAVGSGRRRLRSWATSGPGVWLGRAGLRLLGWSLRVSEVNASVVDKLWRPGSTGPAVYAVWHGRMLMLPYLYGHRQTFHALASRSRDGEIMSRFVAGFGIRAVRGSSSRGSATALRGLARLLRDEGAHVVVVPDGPRGPRFVVKPGAVLLAHLGGAPIVPLGVGAAPRTVLRSWDAFVIPHPFARTVVVFGDPIRVEPGRDRAALERARQALEAALREATREADRLAGAPRVPDL